MRTTFFVEKPGLLAGVGELGVVSMSVGLGCNEGEAIQRRFRRRGEFWGDFGGAGNVSRCPKGPNGTLVSRTLWGTMSDGCHDHGPGTNDQKGADEI
jgi:hypothetical protein